MYKIQLRDVPAKYVAGWKCNLDYESTKLGTYNKCWTLFVIIQFTVLNLGVCFSTFQD